MSGELAERIAAVIASLDRVCPACLAARDRATWELLHRGRVCRTTAVDGECLR